MALPTRASPSFSHCQSLPSGSLHMSLSLIHQRAERRSKKNHNPEAARMKTTSQNPLTLLVGMQTSTATMENSVEIPLKTGNRTAL